MFELFFSLGMPYNRYCIFIPDWWGVIILFYGREKGHALTMAHLQPIHTYFVDRWYILHISVYDICKYTITNANSINTRLSISLWTSVSRASGAAKGTVPQESWSSWPGATCTARPKSTMVTRLLASIIMFLNLGASPLGKPGDKTWGWYGRIWIWDNMIKKQFSSYWWTWAFLSIPWKMWRK